VFTFTPGSPSISPLRKPAIVAASNSISVIF
jgi:hypothetical protein